MSIESSEADVIRRATVYLDARDAEFEARFRAAVTGAVMAIYIDLDATGGDILGRPFDFRAMARTQRRRLRANRYVRMSLRSRRRR